MWPKIQGNAFSSNAAAGLGDPEERVQNEQQRTITTVILYKQVVM